MQIGQDAAEESGAQGVIFCSSAVQCQTICQHTVRVCFEMKPTDRRRGGATRYQVHGSGGHFASAAVIPEININGTTPK